MMSAVRWMTRSTRPPMKPLMSPSPVPIAVETTAAEMPRIERRHRQAEQQPLHQVAALRVRARQPIHRATRDRAHLRDRVGGVHHRDPDLDPVIAVERREAARTIRRAEQRRLRPTLDVRRVHGHPVLLGEHLGHGLRGGRLRAQQHAHRLIRVAHVGRLLARPRPPDRVPEQGHLVAVRPDQHHRVRRRPAAVADLAQLEREERGCLVLGETRWASRRSRFSAGPRVHDRRGLGRGRIPVLDAVAAPAASSRPAARPWGSRPRRTGRSSAWARSPRDTSPRPIPRRDKDRGHRHAHAAHAGAQDLLAPAPARPSS